MGAKLNAQTTLKVVDAGTLNAASPTTALGTYTENGTYNGKPAYQGPNGFWIYWGTNSTFGSYWFINTPEGTTALNGTGGFVYLSSAATPPLFTNYVHNQNSSGNVQIQAIPNPPTATSASSVTKLGFTANWNSTPGAAGYKIDIATDASFSSFVTGYNDKDVGSVTSYTPSSGINALTTYYYRVKAYNSYGTSSVSNTINLTTANNPPVVSDIAKSVNEDNTLTFAQSDFTSAYSDADSDPLSKVKITSLPPHGTLKLSGTAVTLNQEIAAASLGNLTYKPSLNYNGSDSFNYNAFDGTVYATTGAAVNITINAVNDAPVLASIEGAALSYTEGDAATAITSAITVSDVDNTTQASATVSITSGLSSSEDVLSFTNDGSTMGNIAASYNSATGVLTLTSSGASATLVQWQAALRAVKYDNTSQNPSTTTRTVSFVINDGALNSSAVTRDITVTAVNNAPVLASIEGAALSYTEGDAATAITSAITVSDADNTTQSSATVSITSNFASGEDVLSFTNDGSTMGNIAASYNSATGVLSLTSSSASATLAQWQAALRAVKYKNTSQNPSTAARTVSFVINDGALNSSAATRNITVTAVDNAPVLSGIEAAALNYTEGDAATAITSTITVSDVDNTTQASATVSITGNFTSGEDVLSFTNDGSTMGNIAASYNGGTGVLTLTSSGATATLTQWQAALRAVKYKNTSSNPSTAARTVSFATNDGTLSSNTLTRNITVTAVNNAPVLASIEGAALNYTEGDPATAITGAITVSDVDNTTQASATVSITSNFANGEDVLSFTNDGSTMGNIAASYNSATGVLSLTSSGATATLAQWQAALRAVKYNNTSQNPSTATRTVSFVINDGALNSSAATRDITVTAVDNAPVLSGIETAALNYTEGDAATAITSTITVSDVDNTTAESAKVSITGGLSSGEDVLGFTNQNGIVGNYNPSTGVLTLTGGSSLADYQTALRSVTYRNTSNNPSTAVRTLSFVINDGALNSIAVTRDIKVISVDSPPVLSDIESSPIGFTEGGAAEQITNTITVSDTDNTNMDSAAVQITSNYVNGEDVLSYTKVGNITGSFDASTGKLTLAGQDTKADYQSALRAVKYRNTSQTPSTAARTVSFTVSDGIMSSNAAAREISITAINSAPSLTAAGVNPTFTEGRGAKALFSGASVSTIESGQKIIKLVLTAANIDYGSNEFLNIDSSMVALTNGNSVTTETNKMSVSVAASGRTATVTISNSAGISSSQMQTLVDGIAYNNTSVNPDTSNRVITLTGIQDNGGTADGGKDYTALSISSTVKVLAVDNPPVLTGIETAPLSYTVGDSAAAVTNTITASDPDNTTLSGAKISITGGFTKGEDELAFTDQNGIKGSYNAETGVLTLLSSADIKSYQAALRSVTYMNTSVHPTAGERTISFTVNDGSLNSNTETRKIAVTPADNPPVLSSIETSALNFTEGDSAAQITGTITVSDTDNADLASAAVKITSNYVKGQDVLSYTKVGSITGVFDANTGTMTLNGTDTKADYQSALRSVAYQNTSSNPDTSLRAVSFTVSDGDSSSNILTRDLKIKAVDNPPVISFQFRPITIKENETLTLTVSQLYPFISDPDNPDSTLIITYSYKGDNLTLIGKTDTSVTIKPKKNWFGLDTVTVTVSDGILSTSASFAVNVQFVNNPPEFTSSLPDTLDVNAGDTTKVDIFNYVSDVETPDDSMQYSFTAGNDSLRLAFNNNTGTLSLSALPGYDGTTQLDIKVTDKNGGAADTSLEVTVKGKVTGIEALAGNVPKSFEVYQNYPDPFNPSTTIRYGLPAESEVTIKIYNILGQEVSTLFSGTERAGYYERIFNANDLASGIYIYVVNAETVGSRNKFTMVKKMILMK